MNVDPNSKITSEEMNWLHNIFYFEMIAQLLSSPNTHTGCCEREFPTLKVARFQLEEGLPAPKQ